MLKCGYVLHRACGKLLLKWGNLFLELFALGCGYLLKGEKFLAIIS